MVFNSTQGVKVKIKKAQTIAGIKYRVTTRDDYTRAERDCVKQIATARRAGNDNRAAELSEAKSFFQKRARGGNTCAICGVTIARGAIHCRIHSRAKKNVIAAPAGLDQTQSEWRKISPNARVSIVTNPLALSGYYTMPVERVVAKWRDKISEEKLKAYFVSVWPLARQRGTFLNIKNVDPQHWPVVFELGLAACSIYSNKAKLPSWLLTLPIHTGPNYILPTHQAISLMIRRQGGKSFTAAAISKTLGRMKLATPRNEAKHARKDISRIIATKGC